ncbi:MAG: TonB-dependent receptor [Gammaproteobacteria bacterium]|nr:TonB-dependent receptor [Gammaproteobacteria bacterium]
MSRHLPVASLAMAIACSANCLAASSEEDLLLSFGEEEFVSIATGQKQLIAKAPAVASVITAEDIETLGASTLEEVLETVPGVHVSLSSTYLSPIYSIRGIYTDKNPQVLMLVNGVPLTNAHFGDRGGRSSFPVRDIARIEVIRGPGSAVYGADALAGVINVITKSADQIDGTEFGVRAGSFDTTEGWLLNGTQWGELEVAFSLQALSTDGDDRRRVGSDAQSVFDAVAAGFFAPVSRAPGPLETGNPEAIDLRLDLKYRDLQLRAWNWRQDNTGVGPGLALALDPKGGADGDNYLFDLSYLIPDLAPDTTLELRAAYMDINIKTEQTLFPAGAVLPIGDDGNLNISQFSLVRFSDGYIGNPEFYEEHTRLDAILNWNALEKHNIRVAAGYNQQQESGRETKNFGLGVLDVPNRSCTLALCVVDGTLSNVSNTPYVFIEDQDRDVWYASLQDQWQIANDWNLTAGVRYDDYSDFGSTVNPRLALVWDTGTDLTTKLLYGRAFRAPSFAELFVINNPVALGNPDLDPEISNTYELALDYRASFDLRFGFNVFYYDIDDLIKFVPGANGAQVAQNVGQQEGSGFELETEWKPRENLRVIANYAFQKSEDATLNEDAARAPEQQAYLRADWRLRQNWSLTGELHWVAQRNREPADPRDDIDDFTLVNLNLERRNLMERLDLGLRVRNLFDQNASEPSPTEAVPGGSLIPDDFPLEGRSVYLTARLRF